MTPDSRPADARPATTPRPPAAAVHVGTRDVVVGYPGRTVLQGVTFTAAAGERIGLVGENGTGKTTLLHVLAGRMPPTGGEVLRVGTLAMVEQDLEVGDGLTVGDLVDEALSPAQAALEELGAATDAVDGATAASTGEERQAHDRLARALAVAERLGAWDARRRVDEALTRLDAPRETARRLDELSVGERYRARLACRLAARPDVLLLDEPTNHLDEAGVEHLTGVLQQWPGAVVLVTHDRRLLDEVMTGILDLDPSMDGRPVLYGAADYATYRFQRRAMLRRWNQRFAAETVRRAQLARRLDESYEGLSDEWRPPKGSQRHRRATRARLHVKAADRLVQRLEAQAVEVPPPPPELHFPDLPAFPPQADPGHPLLELRGPHVPGRLALPGVRVELPACGRLLVTGPNGAGKSTLLAALAGVLPLERGVHHVAPGVRIGLLAQDDDVLGPWETTRRRGQDDEASGFDAYATHALDLLEQGRLDPDRLVPVAALGLLSEDDLDRPLRELSVGQRRRFDLALALLAAPHVLVLDEPTNHLSVALVDDLTTALRDTSAAVVLATHDRALRRDLADWPTLDLG